MMTNTIIPSSALSRFVCITSCTLIGWNSCAGVAHCEGRLQQHSESTTRQQGKNVVNIPAQRMLIKITKSNSSFGSVDITMVNNTKRIFSYYFPQESDFRGFRFQVLDQRGNPVPVVGIVLSRTPSRNLLLSNVYVYLKPGEQIKNTVAIDQFYNMTSPGIYTVKALGPHPLDEDDFTERSKTSTGHIITTIHNSVPSSEFTNLQSNVLTLVNIGGKYKADFAANRS